MADQDEDTFRGKMLSEGIVEKLNQKLNSDGDALVLTVHLLVELIKHGECRDVYTHRHSLAIRGFTSQDVRL
jgi:hypothetical protein